MRDHRLAPPATAVVAAAVVWLLRETPGQLVAVITNSAAGSQLGETARLDALAALLARGLLWSLAAWALLGLAAAAAAHLPGTVGRAGRAVLIMVVPRALRGSLLAALSAGLALGPVVSAGATPAAASRPNVPAAQSSGGPAVPASAVPASAPAGSQADPTASLPAPRWPGSLIASQPSRPGSSSAPTAQPGTPATTGPAGQPAKTVTVAPGDSLWVIAGRWISPPDDPAATGAAWPKWYAANRAVIGADPDLIRPGQVLRAPSEAWDRQQ